MLDGNNSCIGVESLVDFPQHLNCRVADAIGQLQKLLARLGSGRSLIGAGRWFLSTGQFWVYLLRANVHQNPKQKHLWRILLGQETCARPGEFNNQQGSGSNPRSVLW